MRILGLQGVLAILQFEVNDFVGILFALFEEAVHFEDVIARFSINLRQLHEVKRVLILPIEEAEEGTAHKIDELQGLC